jgi:hypothetical protein
VPAGSPLTDFNGDFTIRSGGTWQNLNVKGCIVILTSAPVTLRNVQVSGTGKNCFGGMIGNDSAPHNGALVLDHVTSLCSDGYGHGFWINNAVATAVKTIGCENGFELNENTVVQDSYISAREATSDGHGDGIQSQGGNNVRIRHNTFASVNPVTSSIITNPTRNNGWIVEENLLSSGSYTIYCSKQGTGWIVRNNRFFPARTGDPHSASGGLTDGCSRPGLTWTGNYRDDQAVGFINANGAVA